MQKYGNKSYIPYLLLTISPKAVSALAEVQAYTVLRIHICLAGLGLKGFQNTEVEEKFDLVGLEHSGTDEWCLEYEGFPLRKRNDTDSFKVTQHHTNYSMIFRYS